MAEKSPKRPIWRRILSYFLRTLLILFVIVIGSVASIYYWLGTPAGERWAANKAIGIAQSQIGLPVKMSRLSIRFPGSVRIEGLEVKDHKGKLMVKIPMLRASLGFLKLITGDISIDNVELNHGYFNLHRYKGDTATNFGMVLNKFLISDDTTTTGKSIIIILSSVRINDFDFNFHDEDIAQGPKGQVDFNNTEIRGFQGNFNNVVIDGSDIKANIRQLSLKEYSGLEVNQFRGQFAMTDTSLALSNFYLETPHSRLQRDLRFDYKNVINFSDFVDSIDITASLVHSVVSIRDIRYFGEYLQNKTDSVVLHRAEIKGKTNNLKLNNLDIAWGQFSYMRGNVQLRGLPDINETFLNINIVDLKTSEKEITRLLPEVPSTPEVVRLGKIKVKGQFIGFINDFVAYANIETDQGKVISDLNLKLADKPEDSKYSGKLKTINLNLGAILDNSTLGIVSLDRSSIKGTGFTPASLNANMDAYASRFDFNGYSYTNINIVGNAVRKMFKGALDIKDPNITLNFDGTINYNNIKEPEFNFKANINTLNLKPLHFTDENVALSTKLNINLTGLDPDRIVGKLIAYDTKVTNNGVPYNIDTLQLYSKIKGKYREIAFRSSLADITAEGTFIPTHLPDFFATLANTYISSEFVKMKTGKVGKDQFMKFDVTVKDLTPIYGLMPEKIYVQPGSYIKGELATNGDTVKVLGQFPRIRYNDFYISNLIFDADSQNTVGDLVFKMNIDSLRQKDSVLAKDIYLRAEIRENHVFSQIGAKTIDNKREVQLNSKIHKHGNNLIVSLDSSYIRLDSFPFILTGEDITYTDKGKISFPLVSLINNEQKLQISGDYQKGVDWPILAKIENLKVSELVAFVPTLDGMNGYINGDVSVAKINKAPEIDANIDITKLEYGGMDLGTLRTKTEFDQRSNKLKVQANLQNDSIGNTLAANAIIDIGEAQTLQADVKLNKTPIKLFEPFLKAIFTDVRGFLTADLKVRGRLDKPLITGDLTLDHDTLTMVFLEAPYAINHTLHFDGKRIEIEDLELVDVAGSKGVINGIVNLSNIAAPVLNLDLQMKNFQVIDAKPSEGAVFYGTVYASGSAQVFGPVDDLTINVDVKNEANSVFNMPIGNSTTVATYEFIKFTTDKEFGKYENKVSFSGLTINMKMQVTPDLLTQIIMDPRVGDEIDARGRGNLAINLSKTGDLTMFGTYTVESGSYKFSAYDIVNKAFTIDNGSSIKWTGDAYNAMLNIGATYSINNVSLAPLLETTGQITAPGTSGGLPDASGSVVNAPRATVNAKLSMKGTLIEPDIYLDFDVVQQQGISSSYSNIANAIQLIRQDDQERNKTVISLLVLNSFPPKELGSSQASSTLTGGIGDLVSNQLNYWLGQVSNDVQLGVNFGPNQDLQVSLNTTLLKGKVNFNGTYDVNSLNRNLNFDVPLSQNYRATIFNRTAPTAIPLQNNNMLGVGISYRKQFDRIKDLFRKKPKENTKPGPKDKDQQENVPGQSPDMKESPKDSTDKKKKIEKDIKGK